MRLPRTLTVSVSALMLVPAMLGLMFEEQYRDVDWIRATVFGNDRFTLVVAVPLLCATLVLVARGSVRGLLVGLGTIAYAVYNYAFYLLGASLNAFFPLYAAAVVLAAITLIIALSTLDVPAVAASFRSATPVRLVGGGPALIGLGLSAVWIGVWGAYVFANQTPVEPEVFKLVAALDLSLMVPGLISGGIGHQRRKGSLEALVERDVGGNILAERLAHLIVGLTSRARADRQEGRTAHEKKPSFWSASHGSPPVTPRARITPLSCASDVPAD